MNYRELRAALKVFGLGERATLAQIKERHRELVRKHHPDNATAPDQVAMQEINAAYELLRSYCEAYRFSFSEEEYLEQYPAERLKRQFGWDPVWGGGAEQEED